MKNNSQRIRTPDALGYTKTSAVEIDHILTELSGLYLERFKTLRTGDHNGLQIINERITTLKTKLKDL